MKKLIIFLFFILSIVSVNAQIAPSVPQYLGNSFVLLHLRGQLQIDSVVYAPVRDTNFIPARIGAIVVRPQDSSAYLGISVVSTPHWKLIGSTGPLISSGSGIRLIKKGVITDSIKTLIGIFTVALDSSSGNTVSFKLINDVQSPGRNYTYRTSQDIGQSKGWTPNVWDSLGRKPNLFNLAKDSIVVYEFIPNQTTYTAPVWTHQSSYNAFTTESVVGDGLQINNTSSSLSNNVVYSPWKSVVGDVTVRAEYRYISKLAGNAYLGITLAGTTRNYVQWEYAIYNINNGQVQVFTASSAALTTVGSVSYTIQPGDIIQISLRRNFQFYTVTINNITQNVSETFTKDDNGIGASAQVNNVNPGVWVGNCNAVLRSFRHYANNYRPDVMILGASISQNAWLIPSYDSSYCGRLQAMSGRNIMQAGGSGETIDDMLDALREIVKVKPRMVVLGEIAYNNINLVGETPSVWQPKYKAFVDSLLQNGIKVMVAKITPANNTTPAIFNAFADSVYANSKKVILLDMYHIPPAWDSTYPNNQNTHYFWDALGHLNVAGGQVAATYMNKFLEQSFRYNVEGANNLAILKNGSDLRMISYDSVGIGTGNWRDRIMVGVTRVGDTLKFGNGAAGTLTALSQGYGITNSPNPIVTTGTVTADTTKLVPYTDTLKYNGIATQTYVRNNSGGGPSYTFPKTVTAPLNAIQLINDSSLTAPFYYYGTDENGNKRFKNLLTATQDTLVVRNGLTYIGGSGTNPDTLQFNNGGHISVVSNVAQFTNDSTGFTFTTGNNWNYGIRNGRPGFYPAVAAANSIGQFLSGTQNVLSLVNDVTSPGNNFYYRTSGSGVKQWATIDAASIPDLAASYIKNQTSLQSSASYNIDGTATIGTGDVTGTPTPSKFNSILDNAASGIFVNGIFRSNQTVASTGSIQAIEGYVKSNNPSGNVVLSIGTIGNAEHAGAGTIGTMRGGQFGTVVKSGGAVTIAQSVFVAPVNIATGATTVTNGYGVYVDLFGAGSGTITNKWNIYTADATAKNEFNGTTQLDGLVQQSDSTTYKPVVVNSSGVVSKGFWNVGAGTYTFNNGIANTSGTVQLGGNVIQHTTIDGVSNAYNFNVQNMATIKLDATSTYITKRVTFDLIGPPLADYTVAGEGTYYLFVDLTGFAAHTITLPAASATEKGRVLHLINQNTSGTNHWSFATTVKDLTNTTVTNLPNSHDVVVTCTGSAWLMIQ